MLKRLLTPFTLCILAGIGVGIVFGDRVFPVIEDTFGDPLDDLIFGLSGALLGTLFYEVVFFRSFNSRKD